MSLTYFLTLSLAIVFVSSQNTCFDFGGDPDEPEYSYFPYEMYPVGAFLTTTDYRNFEEEDTFTIALTNFTHFWDPEYPRTGCMFMGSVYENFPAAAVPVSYSPGTLNFFSLMYYESGFDCFVGLAVGSYPVSRPEMDFVISAELYDLSGFFRKKSNFTKDYLSQLKTEDLEELGRKFMEGDKELQFVQRLEQTNSSLVYEGHKVTRRRPKGMRSHDLKFWSGFSHAQQHLQLFDTCLQIPSGERIHLAGMCMSSTTFIGSNEFIGVHMLAEGILFVPEVGINRASFGMFAVETYPEY